jgi:hypothetical protein
MAGIDSHQKMQGLFQSEISGGTDADLKSFASKTLPTVQKHLRMAQEMANAGMTGGGNMNMGGVSMNSNMGGNMNGNMNSNNRNRNSNSNRNGNSNGNTNNSNR